MFQFHPLRPPLPPPPPLPPSNPSILFTIASHLIFAFSIPLMPIFVKLCSPEPLPSLLTLPSTFARPINVNSH